MNLLLFICLSVFYAPRESVILWGGLLRLIIRYQKKYGKQASSLHVYTCTPLVFRTGSAVELGFGCSAGRVVFIYLLCHSPLYFERGDFSG